MMKSELTKLAIRLAELERQTYEEPDGEIWQLLKREREERGLPPPRPIDYGDHGRDILREFFGYIRENAERAKQELTGTQGS